MIQPAHGVFFSVVLCLSVCVAFVVVVVVLRVILDWYKQHKK